MQPLVNQLATALVTLGFTQALAPGAVMVAAPMPVAPMYLQPAPPGSPPGCWVFTSPIALHLAAKHRAQKLTAPEVASQLVHVCGQQPGGGAPTVFAGGWLSWTVTATTVSQWLQQLSLMPPRLASELSTPGTGFCPGQVNQIQQWQLQYAHARCRSLLRMATAEGWLDNAHAVLSGLWLQHPAELKILQQLLLFPSSLSGQRLSWGYSYGRAAGQDAADKDPQTALKGLVSVTVPVPVPERQHPPATLQTLGSDFEQFYRSCQIWGAVRAQTPELSLARLGLLAALQPVLEFILATWLGLTLFKEL